MRSVSSRSAATVALLSLLLVPAPAAAGWGAPERVSPRVLSQPSLAVDVTGHRHVAARGTDGLWYLTDRSGDWRATRLTRDTPSDHEQQLRSRRPDVSIDRTDGALIVAWIQDYPSGIGGCDLRVRYRVLREGDWSVTRGIPTATCTTSVDVAMRDGRITIAAGLERLELRQVEVVHGRPGSWSSQRLGLMPGPDPLPMPFAGKPSLELDARGHATVAYEQGAWLGDSVRLAVRWAHHVPGQAGLTSDPVERYAGEWVGVEAIDLALDGAGRPRIAWVAPDGVVLATLGASGWRMQRVADRAMDVAVGVDAGGRSVVAVADGADGLSVLRWRSGSWTRVTLDGARVELIGGLARDRDGDLHVAWQRGRTYGEHPSVWVARTR